MRFKLLETVKTITGDYMNAPIYITYSIMDVINIFTRDKRIKRARFIAPIGLWTICDAYDYDHLMMDDAVGDAGYKIEQKKYGMGYNIFCFPIKYSGSAQEIYNKLYTSPQRNEPESGTCVFFKDFFLEIQGTPDKCQPVIDALKLKPLEIITVEELEKGVGNYQPPDDEVDEETGKNWYYDRFEKDID